MKTKAKYYNEEMKKESQLIANAMKIASWLK